MLAASLADAAKIRVELPPQGGAGQGGASQVDPSKYVAAYLSKLLLQREKLDLGLLDSYLPAEVREAWAGALGTLEETGRKVLAVEHGSVVMTLFCPTGRSLEQLQEEGWRSRAEKSLQTLLKAIGEQCGKFV